jgi:hypothetical protein
MNSRQDTSIMEGCKCKECGEIVIDQVNNTQLARFEEWDWFCYCANVECDNHIGEGYFQFRPDWVENTK